MTEFELTMLVAGWVFATFFVLVAMAKHAQLHEAKEKLEESIPLLEQGVELMNQSNAYIAFLEDAMKTPCPNCGAVRETKPKWVQ